MTRRPRTRLAPGQRRAQLLECALRVFARRGLGRAAHAEIAQEAGVSVSTVFVYFPSRTVLVQAVLEEIERFYTEQADRYHREGVPAPRAILDHASAFARSVETHPDHARVWLDWSTAIRDDVWPLYLGFQERIVRKVEATIRKGRRAGTVPAGVTPREAALLIVGSAHMIAQMMFAGAPPARLHRFLVRLVESVLDRKVTADRTDTPRPRRAAQSDS